MSTQQMTESTGLKRDFYHLIINGEKVESSNGKTIKTYNPATGELVAEVAKATKEDAEKAVQAAREAFDHGKWRKFPVNRRSQVLNKIAAIMRSRFNELVELEILDTGKSLDAAKGQVSQAIEDFEFYAGAIVGHRGTVNNMPGQFHNYTEKEPVGVCAQIIPWNYPIMMAAWKIAPAIAVGCSVIVKPASLTPLTAIILGEICLEAGVPAGVVNIVPGSGSEVGDYLVQPSRLYVQEEIYDEFITKFVEKTKKLVLGNPFDKGTHVGAIIDQGQVDVIDGYVKSAIEEGAEILVGGKPAKVDGFEGGFWYEPTVIANVNHNMTVVKEEIFGPVVVVMKFKDEKEAVKLANDTEFGLGSAVWTKDGARGTRVANQIEAGIVMINCPFSAMPGTPFGGYKQSGFGRELCIETLDLYTETKSIVSYYGSHPLNPLGV
jgi:acyl-CoA reductase-like NAD-dependent aldehyde dehydrogenase